MPPVSAEAFWFGQITSVDAPPPLECADVLGREREPFALFPLAGEPPVPIRFHAGWVIRLDGVNRLALLGELDAKLSLPPKRVVRPADLVLTAATVLEQIHVTYGGWRVLCFCDRNGWLGGRNPPSERRHVSVLRGRLAVGEDAGRALCLRAETPEHLFGRELRVVPRGQTKITLCRDAAQTAGQ
jgi:hypothetical protein